MELMTAKQVAEVLGCTDKRVRQIANELGIQPAGAVPIAGAPDAKGFSEEQVATIKANFHGVTSSEIDFRTPVPIVPVEVPAMVGSLTDVDISSLALSDKEQLLVNLSQMMQKTLQATVDDYKARTERLERDKEALVKANEEYNVLFDQAVQHASVKRMEAMNSMAFPWRPIWAYCKEHNLEIKQVFDANYGKVNAYPREAWEEVYGESYSEAPWL